MKPPPCIPLPTPLLRLSLRPTYRRAAPTLPAPATTLPGRRPLHTPPPLAAKVVPVYGTGPPPDPPVPPRVAKHRQRAALLERGRVLRNEAGRPRFWRDVTVRDAGGAFEVLLDARPLRHPTTKAVVRVPATKPALAAALAAEWDALPSSADASRAHRVPLTGLVCRALDLAADDAGALRADVVEYVLRYLDTDSLLCWAPADPHRPEAEDDDTAAGADVPLRTAQRRAADAVVAHLTTYVWPGLVISPVLDGATILPRPQAPGVRDVVRGWAAGLTAWELAGLERAVLAGKSLLNAARLVAEWSEDGAGAAPSPDAGPRFGVEEAARVASLEVDWQTDRWGQVEDTHDVDHEDVRRQLGSVVLLVSGTGKTR